MKKNIIGFALLVGFVSFVHADIILDNFENYPNGKHPDWNPKGKPPFQVSLEPQKVYQGKGALKVQWENKDLWPNFVIGNLQKPDNCGKKFADADAIRMAIAGPAGRIIVKLTDASGTGTGDLADVTVSGGDDYQVYEFPYYQSASSSSVDLTNISEIQFLVDAGNAGSSGTIYIDSIELIYGSGADAKVIATVDNFDNDVSLNDDPNAQDSIPSGSTLLPGPFVTTVVKDPAGTNDMALKVDYNTSPYAVLWVENLGVTDWMAADGISIDIYGSAGGILLKLKDADGKEQEPTGGFVRHDGDQWDTFTWTFESINAIDLSRMGKLIVFVEGPGGGKGTIYFDNLKLIGAITPIQHWDLF